MAQKGGWWSTKAKYLEAATEQNAAAAYEQSEASAARTASTERSASGGRLNGNTFGADISLFMVFRTFFRTFFRTLFRTLFPGLLSGLLRTVCVDHGDQAG